MDILEILILTVVHGLYIWTMYTAFNVKEKENGQS